MNSLDAFIPELFRNALGWTLLHSIWQILAISLTLYLMLRLLRHKRAAFKHLLGLAALALIAFSSMGTFIHYFNQGQTQSSAIMALSESGWIHFQNTAHASPEQPLFSSFRNLLESNLPLLVNLWLIGAFLFAIRLVGNLAVIRNLKNDPQLDLPEHWNEFTRQQVEKMGIKQPVKIFSSILCQSPITFGALKPIILVPTGLVFNLPPAQLEAIITHELAHIKRKDYLVNMIQSVLEVIFFYHPCFWWINSMTREQREMACDELAIEAGVNPKDLAYGLAEVLNNSTENSPEIALPASGEKNPTLGRIKQMLGYNNEQPKIPNLISFTMIFSLILSASMVVACAQKELTAPLAENDSLLNNMEPKEPLAIQDTIPSKQEAEITIIQKSEAESQEDRPRMRVMIVDGDTLLQKGPTLVMKGNLDEAVIASIRSTNPHSFNTESFIMRMDTSVLDPAKLERIEKLIEENVRKMEISGAELEKHMQIWEERNQPRLEELQKKLKEKEAVFREKSKELEAEFEPKMKEFELKMQQWHEKNQPKMEELQQKLKDREVLILERNQRTKELQAELEPKLKELELKMQEWQNEFGPKMEEFHQKMEEWQKKNEHHFQELEKMLKDAFSDKEKPSRKDP
jgi:bla regulator protein blaR1